MEMQEELKEVNNYLIKVQKNRSRIILGVLLGEVLQLRKHVQKLINPSLARMPSVSLPNQDGDQNHGQGRAERRGLVDLSG